MEWPQRNHIHCGHNFTHPTLPAHPVLLLGNRSIIFRSLVVYLVVSKNTPQYLAIVCPETGDSEGQSNWSAVADEKYFNHDNSFWGNECFILSNYSTIFLP